MKILIVDTYYPGFLRRYYKKNGVSRFSYQEQKQALLSACFGTSNFYSCHLNELGHDASDIIANCIMLQLQWARENRFKVNRVATRMMPKWQRVPVVGKLLIASRGLLSILVEQIRLEHPDVLYIQDLSLIPPSLLRTLKSHVGLMVGQIASPLPASEYLAPYDLILTSFPHFVDRIREMGISSEYFRIGFDPIVLGRIGIQEKRYPCTFVGGISRAHTHGTQLLEEIARHTPVQFFGYGKNILPRSSVIRRLHHGEVWGLDMYRTLAQSHITLNRHIDVSGNFANNMRLYEATGCGAMLLTDAKANLQDLFDVGNEVVAYNSPDEAVELIKYYTAHPDERDAIARAGQARTLRDHTYQTRMQELSGILAKYLRARP